MLVKRVLCKNRLHYKMYTERTVVHLKERERERKRKSSKRQSLNRFNSRKCNYDFRGQHVKHRHTDEVINACAGQRLNRQKEKTVCRHWLASTESEEEQCPFTDWLTTLTHWGFAQIRTVSESERVRDKCAASWRGPSQFMGQQKALTQVTEKYANPFIGAQQQQPKQQK